MSEELKPCPYMEIQLTRGKVAKVSPEDYDEFLIRTVKTRINELEEQIEENCTYRSRELVNHEIVVLKWVLSLRKPGENE